MLANQLKGLAIFNASNRGNCSSCHTFTEGSNGLPLLTDLSYHNLGIPKNPIVMERFKFMMAGSILRLY